MELSEFWIWCAFAMSALTCLLHVFVGGPDTVGPLLKSDLGTVSKYTNYYCWHLVTITLAALAAGYFIPIYWHGAWELAVAATLVAAGFALWSIVLNLMVRKHLLALPQWILFTPITIFGILGLS